MTFQQLLNSEYGINDVLALRDLSKSGPCYQIVTAERSYVLKQVDRLDFLNAYQKAQTVLKNHGLIQGSIIPTKTNKLMTKSGYTLIEFVPGEAIETYTDEQFCSIIKHLYTYYQILREVPFAATEIEEVNNWDKLKSVAFMCRKVEEFLQTFELDERVRWLLKRAQLVLSEHVDYFNRAPKQLIHADLGPGNIVFCDHTIKTIIDFTPEYDNELYALAQFLYWTCLWDFSESASLARIRSTLTIYCDGDVPQEMPDGLFLYLLKACMFRIMGPLLNDSQNGEINIHKLQKRMAALETLFTIRQAIE
ncbi:hypothetical protein PaecuDRAFT_2571 [Paenibacillus curdlanolyticus YK9]|uniref:Aminoglycoside phosphotransferase domain-containing protein n=1 Tax=Paenibacillus curdlanolyticus YK9 TaxID=717606 RepID=E0IA82_9BACL|nr:phosphotransferase [Paenibacillus curdlanolyticus]EFM10659.1 hypothetical protein PaecuDRAFT_2571 [Paenibacillus curdlanolyticus YK9]